MGAYGQEYPELFEEIWFVDLESGVADSVYRREAVESRIARVSVASGIMVVSWMFEGGTYFEYLDTAGQPIDVPGPYDGGVPGGVPDSGIWIDQGVVSPDGTARAFLEIDTTQAPDEDWTADLVIWHVVSGIEEQRLAIELQAGTLHGRMDYDGVGVVLGRLGESGNPAAVLTSLRIASLNTGVITELGAAGTPRLIKE